MRTIKRGAVIEYPALFEFESYPRPYLIISDGSHPFHGEEYIGLAITSTDWEAAIEITDNNWIHGGLPKQSAIKPWQPTSLKHEAINDAYGLLRQSLVEQAVGELVDVIGGN